MKKKKILVCGATGFLGKSVYERLVNNNEYQVTGIYHRGSKRNRAMVQECSLIPEDLTRKADVSRIVKNQDVIIQMAAVSTNSKDVIEKPYLHVTDNIIMNSLLLREAYENKVENFIFPSCAIVYCPSKKPHKETDPIKPHPRYFGGGEMKAYIEKQCAFYSQLGRTRHTMVRHSNIYGPNDKFDPEKSHVLASQVIKAFQSLKTNEISIWGDGTEKRDFLYISDLIDFIELSLENNLDGIYNIGSGVQTSITELVRMIRDKVNASARITYDSSKPTLKFNWSVNCEKANLAGWKQEVDLDSGLERTISHYRSLIISQ